jgi:hypothetical protein
MSPNLKLTASAKTPAKISRPISVAIDRHRWAGAWVSKVCLHD